MSRASMTYSTFLAVLFVVIAGCNRSTPALPTTAAERVKTLEARVARMEEDYRSAAATRDQARRQAAQLQIQKAQLEKQLAQLQEQKDQLSRQFAHTNTDLEATRSALAQEQDQLRQRTAERDLLNTRCERIKKGLQTILGQDNASASIPSTSGAGL